MYTLHFFCPTDVIFWYYTINILYHTYFSYLSITFSYQIPGQITTTSAEVTINGGLVRESTQNPLNSGLGIIVFCPEILYVGLVLDFVPMSKGCCLTNSLVLSSLRITESTSRAHLLDALSVVKLILVLTAWSHVLTLTAFVWSTRLFFSHGTPLLPTKSISGCLRRFKVHLRFVLPLVVCHFLLSIADPLGSTVWFTLMVAVCFPAYHNYVSPPLPPSLLAPAVLLKFWRRVWSLGVVTVLLEEK